MSVHIRERFERKLSELRDRILHIGSLVEQEMTLALTAFEGLDRALAREVFALDEQVNAERFEVEDLCLQLIVTQQPMARDLRLIVTAITMVVDLERMGDQAKGVAKVIPHLHDHLELVKPPELKEMGVLVRSMISQAMEAYATSNVELAATIPPMDDDVDRLYAKVFTQIMYMMTEVKDPHQAESTYELLRVARELERYGDLATNVAERVVYMVTGEMVETNVDRVDWAE
jgi:phosphate transport system protein